MTTQRQPKIERYQVVTVDSQESDQYGNLLFTDTNGNAHKIGEKRPQFFDQIIDGRAVKLGLAVYKEKEYIATAELYDGKADPPQTEPITTIPQAVVKPSTIPKTGKDRDAQITEAMFWKELGARIGDGTLEKAWPNTHVRIATEYWREMAKNIGVKFGD